MKYIKEYEELINHYDPQIGDYVICNEIPRKYIGNDDKNIEDFLKNNIGIYVKNQNSVQNSYVVKFNNIPKNMALRFDSTGQRAFSRNEIIRFSPNKKDLETYINANKYNL